MQIEHTIIFHPNYPFGLCSSCQAPLTDRRGAPFAAECVAIVHCPKCQMIYAQTAVEGEIQQLQNDLSHHRNLAVGHYGKSKVVQRILERII